MNRHLEAQPHAVATLDVDDGQIDWSRSNQPPNVGVLRVLHLALLLVLVRLALVALGFQKTAGLVNQLDGRHDPQSVVDPAQIHATKYAISLAAAFLPIRIQCLERSIVLHHRLKRRGVSATLRLGVRAYPFAAHAWVERDGNAIDETPDVLKDFQPILEIR